MTRHSQLACEAHARKPSLAAWKEPPRPAAAHLSLVKTSSAQEIVDVGPLLLGRLERAYSYRAPGLPYVKVNLLVASLHDDPRWPAFLEKMGLAGVSRA